jgi:hypothetical protein
LCAAISQGETKARAVVEASVAPSQKNNQNQKSLQNN